MNLFEDKGKNIKVLNDKIDDIIVDELHKRFTENCRTLIVSSIYKGCFDNRIHFIFRIKNSILVKLRQYKFNEQN